jgi:hypothetical protein
MALKDAFTTWSFSMALVGALATCAAASQSVLVLQPSLPSDGFNASWSALLACASSLVSVAAMCVNVAIMSVVASRTRIARIACVCAEHSSAVSVAATSAVPAKSATPLSAETNGVEHDHDEAPDDKVDAPDDEDDAPDDDDDAPDDDDDAPDDDNYKAPDDESDVSSIAEAESSEAAVEPPL